MPTPRMNFIAKQITTKAAIFTFTLFAALSTTSSAWAVISNTVTAKATGADNVPDGVTASATEEVDLADPVYDFLIDGTYSVSNLTDVVPGEVVTVTATYKNFGNMTIYDVEPHFYNDFTGGGVYGVIDSTSFTNGSVDTDSTDNIIDEIKPGDSVTYSLTHTITQAEFESRTNYNTRIRVQYAYTDGGGATHYDFAATHLINHAFAAKTNTISISKVGYTGGVGVSPVDGTTDDLNPYDVVTYQYLIENTGNVTLTNVNINDAHGGSGTFVQPDIEAAGVETDGGPETNTSTNTDSTNNAWDSLAPGDIIGVTTTYTITEADVLNAAQ